MQSAGAIQQNHFLSTRENAKEKVQLIIYEIKKKNEKEKEKERKKKKRTQVTPVIKTGTCTCTCMIKKVII